MLAWSREWRSQLIDYSKADGWLDRKRPYRKNQPPKIKPVKKNKSTKREADIERNNEQRILFKRAKVKWGKRQAEALKEHGTLQKFFDVLAREQRKTSMPKLGVVDWDVVDVIKRLELKTLPFEPRRMALQRFGDFIWTVTKKEFGEHMGDPLPADLGGWTSDYELVKRALKLTEVKYH